MRTVKILNIKDKLYHDIKVGSLVHIEINKDNQYYNITRKNKNSIVFEVVNECFIIHSIIPDNLKKDEKVTILIPKEARLIKQSYYNPKIKDRIIIKEY